MSPVCTGGLPKIREDKDLQLSHPHLLFWVPLVGGDRVGFGHVCYAASGFLPPNFTDLVIQES